MNVNEVKSKYQELNNELRQALSTMEKSDKVFIIHNEIKALQDFCPHNNGNYDFSHDESCPYCGKKFGE